jgi:hypothetical protein
MCGFGVMSYAGRRPGFSRAAASFSGVLNTLHPTVDPLFPGLYSTWVLQAFLAPLGYDPLSLFGDPVAQRDVWAAYNPADLVGNLRGTKLFVSSGNGHVGPLDPPGTDPSGLLVQLEGAPLLQNQEFIRRATALGLDLTTDLYGPGTHTWPYRARELEKAFPLLMQALGAYVSRFEASHAVNALNAHDLDRVAAVADERFEFVDVGGSEAVHGHEQWRAYCGRFVKAFPDLTQEATNLVVAGESAFAEAIARGAHTGPLETPDGEAPPNGPLVVRRKAVQEMPRNLHRLKDRLEGT